MAWIERRAASTGDAGVIKYIDALIRGQDTRHGGPLTAVLKSRLDAKRGNSLI